MSNPFKKRTANNSVNLPVTNNNNQWNFFILYMQFLDSVGNTF